MLAEHHREPAALSLAAGEPVEAFVRELRGPGVRQHLAYRLLVLARPLAQQALVGMAAVADEPGDGDGFGCARGLGQQGDTAGGLPPAEAPYVGAVGVDRADAETGAVEAVYGIAVDDEHNTVWTTNTRNNSVAVYSQRTGKHLATLPHVNHAREVVVDEKHDLGWASGFGDGTVVAFDTRTYQEKKRVTVTGSSPVGLAVNERSGAAYATDLANHRIIEITPRAESPRLIPAGDGPLSIALSRDGRTAYAAGQADGALSLIDLRKGVVTKKVPTGAGALAVTTDPASGRALAANRTDATVTVVDPHKGTVVKTVPTGANPIHVETADGTAYVVEKSGSGPEGQDALRRFRVGR